MTSLYLVASLAPATFVPQYPFKLQRAKAEPLTTVCRESSVNTRRALVGAAAMLPAAAWADAISDIAARNNARAEEERNVSYGEREKAYEDRQVLILCAIGGAVLISPLIGIKSAQDAIRSLTTGDMDESLRESLKSNDPSTGLRKRPGFDGRKVPVAKAVPRKKGFFER